MFECIRAAVRSHKRRHFEYTSPGAGWFFDIDRTLLKARTRWQKIEAAESAELGTALLLDGITQLVAAGEYQYHEPMAHIPLLSHPSPERVLVIGGGDGALVREVLAHPGVRSVDLAELDGEVVDFCKRRLAGLGGSALADPRVSVHIGDGRAFARAALEEGRRYDVVLMDMTDPAGPSLALYTREFFAIVRGLLADERALFAMHTESPDCRPEVFAKIHATLRAEFDCVVPFVSHVRMYGGLWSWALCGGPAASEGPDATGSPASDSRTAAPRSADAAGSAAPFPISADEAERRMAERNLSGLKIVGRETWESFFALWPLWRNLLDPEKAPEPATDAHSSYGL